MSVRSLFVTHPEVVVDPSIPITTWGLSAVGRARARGFARSLVPGEWGRVVSSAETKAVETAEILCDALGLPSTIDHALGENDRSSTGFLPPEEFERTADAFFANPDTSVRGWETASAAQQRVVSAVRRIAAAELDGGVVYVAHGAVGALLLADLRNAPITRDLDQPRQGCCFTFDAAAWTVDAGWRPLS